MKKLALCLTLAAMLVVPFSAFGLEMLDNSAMDEITGQTGVSIVADDVEIFLNIDRFTYIDDDGLSFKMWTSAWASQQTGAAFNVNEFQIDNLHINAIVATIGTRRTTIGTKTVVEVSLSSPTYGYHGGPAAAYGLTPLQYNYAPGTFFSVQTSADYQSKGMNNLGGTFAGFRFTPQAISIDITDAAPIFSSSYRYILSNSTMKLAAVCITLPTMEVYIDNLNIASMTLTDNVVQNTSINTTDSANHGKSYGAIEMEGVTFTILDGWVEIAPH